MWIAFQGWMRSNAADRRARQDSNGRRDTPEETMARYRKFLASQGKSTAEVEAHVEVLLDRSPAGRKDQMDYFWEWAGRLPAGERFRVTPSVWLVNCVKDVRPGKALDLGLGSGRNSLFLRRQGWDVTGVDQSESGIAQARMQAESEGLTYKTIAADIDTWDFGREQWDLIAAIYGPDPRWAGRIHEALKPGGLLVAVNGAVGPEKVENRVLTPFLRLRVLRYEEQLTRPDYDPVGDETALRREQRLFAQKV